MRDLNFRQGSVVLKLVVLCLAFAALATVVFLVVKGRQQSVVSRAATSQAFITLAPDHGVLPSQVKVFVDPRGQRMVFAKVVVNFDKSQVQLAADPLVSDDFKNVASVTTKDDANSAGQVVVSAGVDPQSDQPLTSATDFATLQFVAATDKVMPTGNNISVDVEQSQVTTLPVNELVLSGSGAELSTETVGGTPPPPPAPSPSPAPKPNGLSCSAFSASPDGKVTAGEVIKLKVAQHGGTGSYVTTLWDKQTDGADSGTFRSYTGNSVVWTAPATLTAAQSWNFTATVKDSSGATSTTGCTKTLSFTP